MVVIMVLSVKSQNATCLSFMGKDIWSLLSRIYVDLVTGMPLARISCLFPCADGFHGMIKGYVGLYSQHTVRLADLSALPMVRGVIGFRDNVI